MATRGEKKVGYSLVEVGTVTLENADEDPMYISIVICQDMMVVLDSNNYKVNIYGLYDGTFMASSGILESVCDMCLMDAMTICVLHKDGLIKIMSIESTDRSRDIKTTRTFRLQGVLMDEYLGVVRFKDGLVVTGVRQGVLYWCIVSMDDVHVDAIHQICEEKGWCRVTTKDTMIYISCWAYESPNTGVYAFDILNPSKCKYEYKYPSLQEPTSIVINEYRNIFVCNYGFPSSIHQLTSSCQPVAIFTQEIPWDLYALSWYNGLLYGLCFGRPVITIFVIHGNPVITVFRDVYQGNRKASNVPVSNERKQPATMETDMLIEPGNVGKGESNSWTGMPPSVPEDKQETLHQKVLNRCLPELVENLDFSIVSDYLIQKGCFDNVIMQDIKDQKTTSDQIRELIRRIQQRGYNAYERFKDCLVLAKQDNLKAILDNVEAELAVKGKDEAQATVSSQRQSVVSAKGSSTPATRESTSATSAAAKSCSSTPLTKASTPEKTDSTSATTDAAKGKVSSTCILM